MKKMFDLIVINTEWGDTAAIHTFETERDRQMFLHGHQWAADESLHTYLFAEEKSLDEYNKENGTNLGWIAA